jgi:hypothetical protein
MRRRSGLRAHRVPVLACAVLANRFAARPGRQVAIVARPEVIGDDVARERHSTLTRNVSSLNVRQRNRGPEQKHRVTTPDRCSSG